MKPRSLPNFLWVLLALSPAAGATASTARPMSFEPNQGQTDARVKFLARGRGYTVFLTHAEAVLSLRNGDEKINPSALRLTLVGASPSPEVVGLDELPGRSNYFVGDDPEEWRTDIPTYASVEYEDVLPGVSLVYQGSQGQLAVEMIVAPASHPGAITLAFAGADGVELEAQGDLRLDVGGGQIRLRPPSVYQEVDGTKRGVASGYVQKGSGQVGFRVASYDRARPLVIGCVLVYSTYFGGSGNDVGGAVAVDSGGSLYLTGNTSSLDFPVLDPFQRDLAAGDPMTAVDVFVSKLNPAGDALVYSTYLGGRERENGRAIAVDGSGHAYVTGQTSSVDFPTVNPFQPSRASPGTQDAFLTKLAPAGNALVYSTYLGGGLEDWGLGIAVDSSGHAYVTGYTEAGNFPTTPSAYQPSPPIPSRLWNWRRNAFVAKLTPDGSALVYSTYLGGDRNDEGRGIALDAEGQAYVVGTTASPDFPAANAIQPALAGGTDAFVAKLDRTGCTLLYATYLGGTGSDGGTGVAVDADGDAHVVGETSSLDFPVVNGVQPALAGGRDGFVARVDGTGSTLLSSTYLGGSGDEWAAGIGIDSSGNAYAVGTTRSLDFPTADAIQARYGGSDDAFVAKLDRMGSALVYSTYLGGDSYDGGYGITLDSAGGAYVTGFTWSTNFPTANPLQVDAPAADAFVVRIVGSAQ